MDQGTLVEAPIDEGRRFLEQFVVDGNPVQAAFWAKGAEDGLWFLFVVSPVYDNAGPAAAYRAVDASSRQLGKTSITGSEIKVIGPGNPIAKDVLAYMRSYPGRYIRGAATLGSVAVDQVFIYPTHSFTSTCPQPPMTSEQIGQELIRLMNRGPGILRWCQINLKDGKTFRGVPYSVEAPPEKPAVVHFLVDEAKRNVQLDEIASIRELDE